MNPLISNEFAYFVECIEGNGDLHQRLTFANAQELQASCKYFFERAVANAEIADLFAKQADRLKYIYPTNEKPGACTNLRKTLVNESKRQMEEINRLLRTDSVVRSDLAKGTYKFFGELFNVGFIFLATLHKEFKLLELINRSTISHECLVILIQTVKIKVLDTPDDHSLALKQLIEAILEPEYNQMPRLVDRAATVGPSRSSDQFPALAGPSRLARETSWEIQSNKDRMDVFAAMLNTLTADNVVAVWKKMSPVKKEIFSNDSWPLYFDNIIAKAFSEPNLADPLATVCHKMSKSTGIWTGVSNDDCKKYVIGVLAKEIQVCPIPVRENAIINFFRMLVKKNYCNVGHIANILSAAVKLAGINKSNSIIVLFKILEIVKSEFNQAKLEKLPEEITTKVVEIISTDRFNTERAEMYSEFLLGQRQLLSLPHNQQKIAEFVENYQTSGSSSDLPSEYLSAESEDEVDDTPENYHESAQKTSEDVKILEKAHKILADLTLENMKAKSFEFLTLMHQNPKKIQLITSSVVEAALSKPSSAESCVAMLDYLIKGCKDSKNTFDEAVAQFIAKFYEKHFEETMISGILSDNNNIKNLNTVRLMCKLYGRKVIDKSLAFVVIRGLLKADNVSEAAVSFVVEIMTTIGSDLEKDEAPQIKKCFDYIQYAVESDKALSFRSIHYTKLMAFRKNGWKTPNVVPPSEPPSTATQNGLDHHKKPLNITIEFDDLDNDDNLYGMVLKLRSALNSVQHVTTFVKALLDYNTVDFLKISIIAKLMQKLSEIRLQSTSGSSIRMVDVVTDSLTEEFTATNEQRVLDKDEEDKLTRLVVLASELFHRNVISEHDLIPWLLHANLYQLPLETLTQVSTVISSKYLVMGNKTLVAAFRKLETKIGNMTREKFDEMQSNIICFAEKLESLRKLSATNPRTS